MFLNNGGSDLAGWLAGRYYNVFFFCFPADVDCCLLFVYLTPCLISRFFICTGFIYFSGRFPIPFLRQISAVVVGGPAFTFVPSGRKSL